MTAADEGVRLEGLIEWHRAEAHIEVWALLQLTGRRVYDPRDRALERIAFHTQAIAELERLTSMGEERDRLREALGEMKAAMIRYQMDVDADPPQAHREMMARAEAALTPQTEAQSHQEVK